MPKYPGFVRGGYQSQSPITDQEKTVNWYPEQAESQGATSQASLYPTPGVRTFSSGAAIGGRAMFSATGTRAFGVYGTSLLEFFDDGSQIDRGTVAADLNPATICTNGDGGGQLFITSGGFGYCYDLDTNVLTKIAGLAAMQGGFLYGYFVAFDAVTAQIRISDLFDGLTWDPTQFAQNSISQDNWKAMLVTPYGQIFLPGAQTGQFWFNAGTFPFPFAPDPAGLIEEGIAATFAIKQASKSAVWLATNKNGGYQVMRAVGFSPQRISDHAVEYELSRLTTVRDAIAETYEDQGHSFFILTFPSAQITKVYDFTTNQWHDRGTWQPSENAFHYWRPVFHCFAFNKHLMADHETTVLWHVDIGFPLDVNGEGIVRLRRAPAVVNQDERLIFSKFEVLLETGLGLSSGQGSNPLVMMRKSDDGGQTWSSERIESAGRIGQYWKRVIFWQTGQARKRVFEVKVSDPITSWRITDAFLDIKRGNSNAAA